MTTNLVPYIGYDRTAALAKTAYETGKTVMEVALSEKIMPEDELKRLLQ